MHVVNTDYWVVWESDCCLTPTHQIFVQLFHGENTLIFNEMMMSSALYSTNTLSWMCTVLAHWNNSPRIDMSPYSDTLSYCRDSHNYNALFYVVFVLFTIIHGGDIAYFIQWYYKGIRRQTYSMFIRYLNSFNNVWLINERQLVLLQ